MYRPHGMTKEEISKEKLRLMNRASELQKQGLSQRQICERLGVRKGTVSAWICDMKKEHRKENNT